MTLTISVCIPCIVQHIPSLDKCIKSIANQIVLPNEVIISISSIEKDSMEMTKITTELLLAKYRDILNIIVLYAEHKQYAGINRNIAVSESTGDIVSFIDADDTMYRNRLYVIRNIFELYPDCMGILHHFTENGSRNMDKWVFNEELVDNYVYTHYIHFGHPSFRRMIFDRYKYSYMPRGQDMAFFNVLLPKYINKFIIYKGKLTDYNSKDSTFFNLSEDEQKKF